MDYSWMVQGSAARQPNLDNNMVRIFEPRLQFSCDTCHQKLPYMTSVCMA